MYPTYLSKYNQLINVNSPLSISQTVNVAGGNIIMQADITITNEISTTNNQIIFMTSHRYSDDYFCTVGSYNQQAFNLTDIGQEQTFENIIPINQDWDMETIKVIVLIQSMQNKHILQASSSQISLDNLLVLNTIFNSIENDDDLDGLLNPGEEAILNLSLDNNSILLSAQDVFISLSSEEGINIEINEIELDEFMEIGEIIEFSIPINIDDIIELGNKTLNILVNANYTDTYGDDYTYEVNFPISLDINLNQVNWPMNIESQIVSSPAIVDINNDGYNEVIFGDYNGMLHVLDHNGNMLDGFPFEANDDIWASPAIGDIDNDGQLEIAIVSKDKHLYVLDAYGNVELNYNANQFLMATPVLCQMDQDPELEIVFSGYTSSGDVFAINHDGTNLDNFPASINEKILTGAAVSDLNGNGLDDILVATETENMLCMILDNGSIDTLFIAQDKFKSSPTIIKSNFNENWILVSSKDHNLYALDFSGDLKFIYTTLYEITSSPVAVDINSNTIGIFFGGQDGYLYGINQDGDDLPGWPIALGGQFTTSASIADLDNNGFPEVVCGNSSGDLYAFHLDGTLVNYFPIEYSLGISTTPSIIDLDNDGDLEIFSGVTDMIAGIDFKVPGSNLNYWNLYRANLLRNGTYISTYSGSCSNPIHGDLNCDGAFNVVDIITLVNIILDLSEYEQFEIWASDINEDGISNIFDVILLINLIL